MQCRVMPYLFVVVTRTTSKGYDMTWNACALGDGWKQSGPNSPLDGLQLALQYAISQRVDPSKLVLGLPWYGRLYTCDSTASSPSKPDSFGSTCSCNEKNVAKKTLDLFAAAADDSALGCTAHYDEPTATPWIDCPHGANITSGGAKPTTLRQQGWYENAKSLQAKLDLAVLHKIGGVGVWTAHGVNAKATEEGGRIWDAFANYVKGATSTTRTVSETV